ncbi:MAG: sigma 54-interacting transcriptional regulator, partial [Desulfobacteraceae bacterium]
MENHTPLDININSRHLQAFFDFSSDGLLIFDGKGKILAINRTSERFNGFKASEIAGKNIKSLVEEGYIDRSATQEVIETKRQVSIIQYVKMSGYQLLVTGIPVFDDKEEIEFIIVNERDMSLLNNMRKELEQTRKESDRIREELTEINLLELSLSNIVAESDAMKQTLKLALKLSRIDASNILITGESGTGKGLLAKFIHKNSPRSKYPFIQINCAALPENLLEAELFGYEPGAFSGASEKGKAGLFELASRGTIFLDEIGELPFHIQAKLLKYLDDHEVIPLGGTVAKTIKCSVITATNRDLEAGVAQKSFRLDLLYRLNTFTL